MLFLDSYSLLIQFQRFKNWESPRRFSSSFPLLLFVFKPIFAAKLLKEICSSGLLSYSLSFLKIPLSVMRVILGPLPDDKKLKNDAKYSFMNYFIITCIGIIM